MYKACSKCGKIHSTTYKCSSKRVYVKTEERKLRNTNKWHMKSDEIKERSNYLCSICRDKGIYNYNNLEVHHIDKVGDAPERLLDNYNLLCLCVEHHKMCDRNEIDKEYQFKLAKMREDSYK